MILLVEDNALLLALLLDVLSEAGRPVLSAESRQEAEALLAKDEPIELLIADLNLPDGSGIELSRAAWERRPGIKVLLMSGYAVAPGIDFILKPFAPEEFLTKVRSLLEG